MSEYNREAYEKQLHDFMQSINPKPSAEEMDRMLKNYLEAQKPRSKVGEYYRHFKGNVYQVLGYAKHSETDEDMVIYQCSEKKNVWVRPLSIFIDIHPEHGVKRFERIKNG